MTIKRYEFWRGLRERAVGDEHAGQYGAGAELKVLKGAREPFAEEAAYDGGWDLKQLTDEATGAEYFKLWVVDADGSRAEKLKVATVFEIDGVRYKKNAADPPKGLSNVWDFRVQPV